MTEPYELFRILNRKIELIEEIRALELLLYMSAISNLTNNTKYQVFLQESTDKLNTMKTHLREVNEVLSKAL